MQTGAPPQREPTRLCRHDGGSVGPRRCLLSSTRECKLCVLQPFASVVCCKVSMMNFNFLLWRVLRPKTFPRINVLGCLWQMNPNARKNTTPRASWRPPFYPSLKKGWRGGPAVYKPTEGSFESSRSMMSWHTSFELMSKLCLIMARAALSFSEAKANGGLMPRVSKAMRPTFKPAQSAPTSTRGEALGAPPPRCRHRRGEGHVRLRRKFNLRVMRCHCQQRKRACNFQHTRRAPIRELRAMPPQ